MSDTDSETASSIGEIVEEASEPDTTSFKCLFCDLQCARVSELLPHCRAEHGFDLEAAVKRLGPDTDELDVIKLVNYLRAEAARSMDPKAIKVDSEAIASDRYLQPTLSDDALLFELGDLMPDPDSKAVDFDEFETALQERVGQDVEKISLQDDRDMSYFESYKGAAIHREMIEDSVRTQGYRDFVEKNAELFAGKVVLDVGCGTGILSLFCARAGAKKVFAVDNSDIALRAREIVAKNGYGGTIEVIQGKVEDFHTQRMIGKQKVDIIISEWMGYGLLFEGMLDSVLRARDLCLKEDGLMVPSHCTLRIAPVAHKQWVDNNTGKSFWDSVYGFDFSPMARGALTDREIGVFDVPEKALGGEPSTFYTLDLKRIEIAELDFSAPFSTRLSSGPPAIDGFAIWFDTFFLVPGHLQDAGQIDVASWGENGEPGLGFSTGPYSTPTHWHQAVLVLDEEDRHKEVVRGSVLRGSVEYKKTRRDVRGVDVTVRWEVDGVQGPITGTVKRKMS